MNYETAKVRMPSVLMNEKIYFAKIYAQHYFGKTKISSNQDLEIFYTINHNSFQYLKIILRFI